MLPWNHAYMMQQDAHNDHAQLDKRCCYCCYFLPLAWAQWQEHMAVLSPTRSWIHRCLIKCNVPLRPVDAREVELWHNTPCCHSLLALPFLRLFDWWLHFIVSFFWRFRGLLRINYYSQKSGSCSCHLTRKFRVSYIWSACQFGSGLV